MTQKQKRFVEEYLVDLNATQAAIRAGYSPAAARGIGCENLTKPNIRAPIERAMAERSKRAGANKERVVAELEKIAFANAAEGKARMAGKLKALELLGRHMGMWNDRLELSGGLEAEKAKLDEIVRQMKGEEG